MATITKVAQDKSIYTALTIPGSGLIQVFERSLVGEAGHASDKSNENEYVIFRPNGQQKSKVFEYYMGKFYPSSCSSRTLYEYGDSCFAMEYFENGVTLLHLFRDAEEVFLDMDKQQELKSKDFGEVFAFANHRFRIEENYINGCSKGFQLRYID